MVVTPSGSLHSVYWEGLGLGQSAEEATARVRLAVVSDGLQLPRKAWNYLIHTPSKLLVPWKLLSSWLKLVTVSRLTVGSSWAQPSSTKPE